MTRLTFRGGSCFPGTDAWSRTAARVDRLSAGTGRPLDDDLLLLSDIRDLQRMAMRLESHARRPRRLV